ncbi:MULTISPECIES: SAP domain-containing protein [unclassified Leucobacter]|uniref:SAP domain-containing protein n=1 Tax=unclassified Leucobacter TaxID=2621730 RepID=UPI00301A8595
MAHIQTPVKGFTGKVAGVSFADGAGETEDPAALAYFERHGYTVEAAELTPKQKLQAEAKSLGLSEEGTKDELEARIAEHKAKGEQKPTDPPAGGEGKEQG